MDQVVPDAEVRDVEDWRVRIAVDGDDRSEGLRLFLLSINWACPARGWVLSTAAPVRIRPRAGRVLRGFRSRFARTASALRPSRSSDRCGEKGSHHTDALHFCGTVTGHDRITQPISTSCST